MKRAPEHLEMKWQWFDNGVDGTVIYTEDEKHFIAGPIDEDTCECIVREHNSAQELLEALNMCVDAYENNKPMERVYRSIKEVIAKAKGINGNEK